MRKGARRSLQTCYQKDPSERPYDEGEIQRLMAWRQWQTRRVTPSGSPGFYPKSCATDSYSCALAGGNWSNNYCY